MRIPLFPIGKTQWSKWQDPARSMYNEEIGAGSGFAAAVAAANEVQRNTRTITPVDILEQIAEVAETVTEVVTAVAPVVAVTATVAKRPRAKKGK
mgnify:CR=1 FL=1